MDMLEEKRVAAIKVQPVFWPLLETIILKPASGIALIVGPKIGFEESDAATPCFWWRRGRPRSSLSVPMASP